jgi:Coenzyme PQQ synthesis protein D (PqqD)
MSFQNISVEKYPLIHSFYEGASNVLFRCVEDEAVLLYVPSGTYYGLNTTGIMLWEAIQNKQSLLSVVDKILEEYDVDRTQVLDDLEALIQDLLGNKLIVKSSPQD